MFMHRLPNELLLKVHGYLPRPDLSSAVLVNKKWRNVGEDPSLWSDIVVTIRYQQDVHMMSIGRLAKVREIQVWNNLGNPGWKMFFKNVEKLHNIEYIIGLRKRDLKGVEARLLGRALVGVEKVGLGGAKLTTHQVVSLFTQLARPDTRTKELELDGQDLSSVPADQLAIAVNKLEEAQLWDSNLKTDQLTAILTQIIDNETNLKKLTLRGNDLSGVAPDTLATAVSKVKDVSLGAAQMWTSQLTSIFNIIVEKDTQLKYLWVGSRHNLQSVDKDLVLRAKDKLGGGLIYY